MFPCSYPTHQKPAQRSLTPEVLALIRDIHISGGYLNFLGLCTRDFHCGSTQIPIRMVSKWQFFQSVKVSDTLSRKTSMFFLFFVLRCASLDRTLLRPRPRIFLFKKHFFKSCRGIEITWSLPVPFYPGRHESDAEGH